jgi:hypothetical protein
VLLSAAEHAARARLRFAASAALQTPVRCCIRAPQEYRAREEEMIRKFLNPIIERNRPKPIQPFGADFGLTIFPDYIRDYEVTNIQQQYVDLYVRAGDKCQVSDGRIQLPPLQPSCFAEVLDRMYEQKLVPMGYLNNQTVNMYQPGSFIRAHVDNMFIYDGSFAVLSLGAPGLLKFVHMQNGEELEAVIPEKSVYILEGPARYIYLHMVPPVESQRVSIVLRRSIMKTTGTFYDVHPQMKGILPHRANAISSTLLHKAIGVPRIHVDEHWMEENQLGMFDTGEMVRRLHPMRDWSLKGQLDEDEERYQELLDKEYIDVDFKWRFAQLRETFKSLEAEMTSQQS